MALAIDSTHLAKSVLPVVQNYLDAYAGHAGRYQVYRVCAHAKVIHGASFRKQMLHVTNLSDVLTNREADEWQPDQDDDLDEAEVIHHLNQQAAKLPWLEELLSQPNHSITTTTMVTSVAVQPPSLTATTQGRPISSFDSYSFRVRMLHDISKATMGIWPIGSLQAVIPIAPVIFTSFLDFPQLRTAGPSSKLSISAVLWHLQFDFVDLLSQRSHPAWRPTRRRRTTLNAFHQVSSAPPVHDSSQQQYRPEAKRFHGVCYRPERRTWSAEMKPPKSKSKVYFGESQSQAQVARIVDVAYHYYGKPGFLNFPDETPQELLSRVIPAGLDEKCKLKFVKEQAKWLASEASKQPLSPASVHSDILVSPSGGFTLDTSQLLSLSEIVSLPSLGGDGDEADDGMSRLQPSLLPDAEAGSGGDSDWLEIHNGSSADAVGAMVGASDEGQGENGWNVLEDAQMDAGLCASSRPSSSVRITDGWDGAESWSTPASTIVGNSSSLSGESHEWWMNYLALSPPTGMSPMPCSLGHFQDDIACALMEQQSLGVESWLSG